MSKRVMVGVIAVAALVGAGVTFDRHRAETRNHAAADKRAAEEAKNKVPPLPQHGDLLAAADEAEVMGTAMCGYYYWHEGGASCNTVLQTPQNPGIVFLLPNEKRTEIEKLTGTCAGGNYGVKARGAVTQYAGHNYMLVKSFEAVKTK